jgi:cystathionine gamma-synthase
MPDLAPATMLAQSGHYIDPVTGSIIPPIYPSATFARDRDFKLIHPDHLYTRDDDPTLRPVELMLATLEKAADAMLYCSGMSAVAGVFTNLRPGDHVVIQKSLFYGVIKWPKRFCERWQIDLDFFDVTVPGDLERLIQPGRTRMVWIETPSNPFLHVVDISACAAAAHEAGAILVVDSTTATPILSNPIDFGADLVVHSATKYIGGHSDVLAGLVVTAKKDDWWEVMQLERQSLGPIPSPHAAAMLSRSLRTLALRVERHCQNAQAVAAFLQADRRVKKVFYPGLPDHPNHDLARRQMRGFSGLLSFQAGRDAEESLAIAGRLNVIYRATSWGSTESLLDHRFTVESGSDYGSPPDLLRISVGLEDVNDLIADLDQALG